MSYWILNKKTEKPDICTSLKKVAKETGINVNILYFNFSRKKKVGYENNEFRIVKI